MEIQISLIQHLETEDKEVVLRSEN